MSEPQIYFCQPSQLIQTKRRDCFSGHGADVVLLEDYDAAVMDRDAHLKDAGRYRWLIEHSSDPAWSGRVFADFFRGIAVSKSDLDAAIDAEMSSHATSGKPDTSAGSQE